MNDASDGGAGAAGGMRGGDLRSGGALRVAVVSGGLTHERDVSIRSGRRVAGALRDAGAEVTIHDLDSTLVAALAETRPDVVWPLVHGAEGEDGSLQDMLAMLGYAFVGPDAAGARLASDKSVAKAALSRAGLTVPDSVTLPQTLFREVGPTAILTGVVERLGLPLVVKPARGGSALGVSVVHEAEQLPAAMVGCFAYGAQALLERFVEGIEVAVSVVELDGRAEALPSVEIEVSGGGAYDFDARYNAGEAEFYVPARLSPSSEQAAAAAALAVHDQLGLRDLSRTDLIVDAAGIPWVLDVNVAPGMTETSLFPQAARAAGTSSSIYLRIAQQAAARG